MSAMLTLDILQKDEGENILDEIRMRTSLNVTLFFYFLVIAY